MHPGAPPLLPCDRVQAINPAAVLAMLRARQRRRAALAGGNGGGSEGSGSSEGDEEGDEDGGGRDRGCYLS
jgi:hypothetical protein